MANTIIAGNATNNGLAFSSDSTGTLNILTGTGSGTTALSIDASQNVTAAANLSVTGNATITGTLSATNGITGSLKSATAQASTSGTSIDFTGIPAGVKRITVMMQGVKTSGTSFKQIQFGTSGGIDSASYVGAYSYGGSGAGSTGGVATTGFVIGSNVAAETLHGAVIFTLLNASTNLWTATGSIANNTGTFYFYAMSGSKALSSALTTVRITTVNGTDTFAAGSINIIYE